MLFNFFKNFAALSPSDQISTVLRIVIGFSIAEPMHLSDIMIKCHPNNGLGFTVMLTVMVIHRVRFLMHWESVLVYLFSHGLSKKRTPKVYVASLQTQFQTSQN